MKPEREDEVWLMKVKCGRNELGEGPLGNWGNWGGKEMWLKRRIRRGTEGHKMLKSDQLRP